MADSDINDSNIIIDEDTVDIPYQPLFQKVYDNTYVMRHFNPSITLHYHSKVQRKWLNSIHNNSKSLSVSKDSIPTEVPPLFADNIWPGSLVLSDFICKNPSIIDSKFCIELGAAYGLPSMVACKLNAKYVVVTDYPAPYLLENINELFYENNIPVNKFHVINHIWGDDTTYLINLISNFLVNNTDIKNINDDNNESNIDDTQTKCQYNNQNNIVNNNYSIQSSFKNNTADTTHYFNENSIEKSKLKNTNSFQKYDVIILAELLWKDTYKQHKNLVKSIQQLISYPYGIALLSFAHRPSYDGQHTKEHDLEFLNLISSHNDIYTSQGQSESYHLNSNLGDNNHIKDEINNIKLKVTLLEINTEYTDVAEENKIEVFLYKLSFL